MHENSWTIRIDDAGSIRTITCSNPPVNALGHGLRVGLIAALDDAASDPDIQAVILTTQGRGFFSGADIRELDDPSSPRVFDLTAHIERLSIPVFAAMHGTALGGGLEVALACHARVAKSGSRIGFPEVNLGLIPGAGGTQYAPRLSGPVAALSLICSGKPISAGQGAELGFLDVITDQDPVDAARELAVAHLQSKSAIRRIRDLPTPAHDAAEFEDHARKLNTSSKHKAATKAAIVALKAAISDPFETAIGIERKLFEELRTGAQARALRYQFLAERKASHVPGVTKDTPIARVETVGIIGGGTMGRGIALAFLASGFSVRLIDRDGAAVTAAYQAVLAGLDRDLERGRISDAAHAERRSRFSVSAGDASAVGPVDLVIEAAFEDMSVKKEIFTSVEPVISPAAILATNTSSLDIDEMASVTAHPERVVGMHFFSPANIMRLLEVVRAEKTSPETLATVLDVAKRLRKAPVVVGVCDGFVGNRMLAQRHIAAERLLLEGALPEQVDKAWADFGFPMGVFAMTDLAGVDVNWRVRKARGAALAIHDAVYELGRYGQKTGAGFYRYAPGKRVPIPDPEIADLVCKFSEQAGLARREISDDEILSRLLFPMINEGARLIEAGIAQRASDIDVVWVNGYGWPAWRGGPMYHADHIGLSKVADALGAMAQTTGNPRLQPAPLLVRLAAEGLRFTD